MSSSKLETTVEPYLREMFYAVPTIDLTIHFREVPDDQAQPCLVRFRSRLASGGYVEEDGDVWSHDGRLLAHSRQLALALPLAGW